MDTAFSVSNAAIARATVITAKDPAKDGWFLLWRGSGALDDRSEFADDAQLTSLEIVVHEDDDGAMLDLINRIERIKGGLPWEAQALRRLIQAPLLREEILQTSATARAAAPMR